MEVGSHLKPTTSQVPVPGLQRSHGGPIVCFDRELVRNAGQASVAGIPKRYYSFAARSVCEKVLPLKSGGMPATCATA